MGLPASPRTSRAWTGRGEGRLQWSGVGHPVSAPVAYNLRSSWWWVAGGEGASVMWSVVWVRWVLTSQVSPSMGLPAHPVRAEPGRGGGCCCGRVWVVRRQHQYVIVAAAVPVSRCGVVSDEVAGSGAFSYAYLVPATHPWGPLTPNNSLTSHLDGEEGVGTAMATATADTTMATADAAVATGGHGDGRGNDWRGDGDGAG